MQQVGIRASSLGEFLAGPGIACPGCHTGQMSVEAVVSLRPNTCHIVARLEAQIA